MCCYWTHLNLVVGHWLEGCWRLYKDNSGCKNVCLHEHYKHACCDNTNCMLDAFKFDTIYKLPSLIPIQVFCCLQQRETGLCSFRYAIEKKSESLRTRLQTALCEDVQSTSITSCWTFCYWICITNLQVSYQVLDRLLQRQESPTEIWPASWFTWSPVVVSLFFE